VIPRRAQSTGIASESTAASPGSAVAIVGGLLIPLGVFAALAVVVAGRTPSWDAAILRFSDRHSQTSVENVLEVTLKASIGIGAAIAVGAVIVLLARRRWSQALFWALAVGGVMAFDLPLKEIFRRTALGDHGGGYSFPSGNAMGSVTIVAAIALTSSPRWRGRVVAIGVPFVLAYGAVIVYLWWHYPSDVVAGWCVALAWVTVLSLALRPTAGTTGFPPALTAPPRATQGHLVESPRLWRRGDRDRDRHASSRG
jgi:membrane-associated phospholipid phosphatase